VHCCTTGEQQLNVGWRSAYHSKQLTPRPQLKTIHVRTLAAASLSAAGHAGRRSSAPSHLGQTCEQGSRTACARRRTPGTASWPSTLAAVLAAHPLLPRIRSVRCNVYVNRCTSGCEHGHRMQTIYGMGRSTLYGSAHLQPAMLPARCSGLVRCDMRQSAELV
jgi:hypothetical protein